ncbi:CheB methylesterase domain-containing protein [Hydrogenimonas urashimensis]|uniref:CheB methylesterase domain-containing protein n=1 Tax=Hydrogenimonas urashimensis TaxID=2740515 RepID=UPI0019155197|nr:CheB methylesterase domain-containing protein [Hydrogenimonas urashimensis]
MRHLVLVGASTGGPGLIETILDSKPPISDNAMIIAQHMDPLPLHSFAKRLERLCGQKVVFANEDLPLEQGTIYLLGRTSILIERSGVLWIKRAENHIGFYNPTIDILFESASRIDSYRTTAILLSGIGADGARGMKRLKEAGHTTIAQDKETSVVYGMPKAAVELGAADHIMPIDTITRHITELLS